MDYRKGLIAEGKIHHPSGKQEMITAGVFDDIDIMLSCHAMGLDMEKYHAEIGAEGGFCVKIPARRLKSDGALYSYLPPVREAFTLVLRPYYTWANRGENDMQVWFL